MTPPTRSSLRPMTARPHRTKTRPPTRTTPRRSPNPTRARTRIPTTRTRRRAVPPAPTAPTTPTTTPWPTTPLSPPRRCRRRTAPTNATYDRPRRRAPSAPGCGGSAAACSPSPRPSPSPRLCSPSGTPESPDRRTVTSKDGYLRKENDEVSSSLCRDRGSARPDRERGGERTRRCGTLGVSRARGEEDPGQRREVHMGVVERVEQPRVRAQHLQLLLRRQDQEPGQVAQDHQGRMDPAYQDRKSGV